MTDAPKQPGDPGTPQDDQLSKELETLYRRVASFDSREAGSDMDENPNLYYKALQIRPDASLADIHFAYKRMAAAWDPERYPHVSSWRETSTEKLKEIKNAYEKLLLLHSARKTDDGGEVKKQPLTTAFLSFPERPDAEEKDSVREDVNTLPRSGFKLRPWMIAPGLLIVIILPLFFLWPTLYHYDAIRFGGKDYPLRINRLTTHAQYYDGRQWREPPLIAQEARRVPAAVVPPPVPAGPARAGGPGEPQEASPPQIKDMTPQAAPAAPAPARSAPADVRNGSKSAPPSPAKGMLAQVPPPASPAEPDAVRKISKPRMASAAPEKPKMKSPDRSGLKAKTGKPFSIQISAYPERGKADALAEKMRAAAFPIHVDVVTLHGKGQWYRVLLGRFEDRDAALRYLREHRINEAYPGSFIQRATPPSE